MGSFNHTPNFDNLLLQTLMGPNRPHHHLRHPLAAATSPLATSNLTLEDLLFDSLNLSSESEDDDGEQLGGKSQLSREESRLEKEIIRTILGGKIETLKPNSGQAVTINDHHICVGFHQEADSGYRVWEWHGHIMLFDEENGYSPEYIYGNYFERVKEKRGGEREKRSDEVAKEEKEEVEEEEEEKLGNLGLRELIGVGEDTGNGRILHRNLNAGSPRFDSI